MPLDLALETSSWTLGRLVSFERLLSFERVVFWDVRLRLTGALAGQGFMDEEVLSSSMISSSGFSLLSTPCILLLGGLEKLDKELVRDPFG